MIRLREARVPLAAFAVLAAFGFGMHPAAGAPFAALFAFTLFFFTSLFTLWTYAFE